MNFKRHRGGAKIVPAEPHKFFLPTQAKLAADKSLKKYVIKPRQAGVSLVSATSCVRSHALETHRTDTWVSTMSEGLAMQYINDCKLVANIYNMAVGEIGQAVLDGEKRESYFYLPFANGTKINALSSNPNAQAGRRGHRILDEFALHKQAKELWAIAYPGTTWGGGIDVISTPRGDNHPFYRFYKEIKEGGNPKGFKLFEFTLQDLLNEGYLYKIQQKLLDAKVEDERIAMDEDEYLQYVRNSCADEESFLREYMCQFSSEASAFITYDLIDPCLYAANENWEVQLDPAKVYYFGMDIGRKKDLSVIHLIEADGNRRLMRRQIVMNKMSFAEQQATADRYLCLPHVRRACIDSTGIGMQLAEECKRRHGHKVEEVSFTNLVKEDLAITLRRCMEDQLLRMPNDSALIADMRKIKKSTTSAGNVRYEGDSDEGGHSDRFWALALALHAAKNPSETFAPRALNLHSTPTHLLI